MRNFYARLFAALALGGYDHVDVDRVILETYVRMMERFTIDWAEIPAGHCVELGYDELQEAPLPALARIYETLGLSGYEAAQGSFARYLAAVETYQKNSYTDAGAAWAHAGERLKPFLERWSYTRPS
jgi:hypothetical protein